MGPLINYYQYDICPVRVTGFFFRKEVSFLFGVILIIAYVVIAELTAIWLNRSIIRTADMHANIYIFNVRYTGFSIFFSTIMCSSLIAFAYFFTTESGSLDSRSITAIIILVIELFESIKKPFFKVEISGDSINSQSIIRRANFTFNDINKIEITKVFGLIIADIFSNDKKMFTLNSEMVGYSLFIDRLKNEDVEWVNVIGKPVDNSKI